MVAKNVYNGISAPSHVSTQWKTCKLIAVKKQYHIHEHFIMPTQNVAMKTTARKI